MPFELFSPAHLAILAAVPLAAAALAAAARRRPGAAQAIRLALAATLAATALVAYGHALARGEVDPPHGLPLDLCDVLVWLTALALVRPRAWALDLVYYLGLAGSGMALLTPDVGAPLASVAGAAFFVAHGAVVAAVLFLVWTGALRPRPGSWWRVFLQANAYAAVVAAVNARFGTNFMYLREKPRSGTLLDLLGPWPWYVLAGEGVALALLALLYVAARRGGAAGAVYAPTRARRRGAR